MRRKSNRGKRKDVIKLRTFGECTIEIGEKQIAPDAEIVFALVLYLSVERGRNVPRERLRELLWPLLRDAPARQCLRQALYKIRTKYGAALEVTQTHVRLDVDVVSADFDPVLSPGWESLVLGGRAPAGEFLPEYSAAFSAPFREWVETQRDLVHSRLRVAISAAMAEARTNGEWNSVEALARRCLQLDPLNEEATIALAEAVALGGSKSEAIALLDSYLIEVGESRYASAAPVGVMRRRIAERLSDDPYLRTTEGAFVGRSESMRVLQECMRRTLSGASTSAYVWGEPGIGKSRLADEFVRKALISGSSAARVVCQSSDMHRPLAIFADILPQLLALPGALGCSPESLAHLRRLTAQDSGSLSRNEELQDAESLSALIRRSLYDLMDAISGESSVLIVAEDVHWADPASLKLLREMIAWAGPRQLLFLLTSRTPPAFGTSLAAESSHDLVVHRLNPLSDESAAKLLESLAAARGRRAASEFVEWSVRVAEGNPLYLRELLSGWLETGELHSVPPTLNSLLTARIAALGQRELLLLQACGVLRRHGRLDRLRELLGYSNLDLLESVERLGSAGLIVAEGERTECRHELIAAVAEQHLSGTGRQALCRMAAELLEREAFTTKEMSILWDCTKLWHKAGDMERVVNLLSTCSEGLVSIGRPSDAAVLLEKALGLTLSDEVRLQLTEQLLLALHASEQYARVAEVIGETQQSSAHANGTVLPHNHQEILLLEAEWRTLAKGVSVLDRTFDCITALGAPRQHRLQAAELSIAIADFLGDAASVQRAYEAVSPVLGDGEPASGASLRLQLMYHTSYGSLTDALRLAESLIEASRTQTLHSEKCRSLRHAAVAFRRAGHFDRAIACLFEALDVAERYQLLSNVVPTIEALVQTFLDAEDLSQAHFWYRCGQARLSQVEHHFARLSMTYLEAEMDIIAGRKPSPSILTDQSLQNMFHNASLRAQVYSRALHAASRVMYQQVPRSETIAELVAVHLATRQRGGQDFPTYCISIVLNACNRAAEARSLLADYIGNYRRERGSPPARLLEYLSPDRRD